jgi:hypothetical protein
MEAGARWGSRRVLVTKRFNEVEKTSREGAAGCEGAAVDVRCSTKEAMNKGNKAENYNLTNGFDFFQRKR